MKRAQFVFYILWAGATAFMVLFGGQIMYQAFYILTLILMLGIAFMLCVYFLVGISVKTEDYHGVSGGQIPLIINVKSMFIVPVPAFVLTFADNPQISCIKEYAITLYPYTKRNLRVKLGFKCRGVYKVGVTRWRASDYFGIFSTGRRANAFCNVTVLPRILTVSDRPPLPPPETDSNAESLSGELSGARPYTGTDSMKNIHWKLSAKSEELYTKQFTGTTRPPTWVFIDLTVIKSEDKAVFEDKLLETALSLVNYLLEASPVMCVAVSGEGMVTVKVSNASEFYEYYREIGLAEFSGDSFTVEFDGFDMEETGNAWFITSDDDILPQISTLLSYDWDVRWVNITPEPDEKKLDLARSYGALVQHVSLEDKVSDCAWMFES